MAFQRVINRSTILLSCILHKALVIMKFWNNFTVVVEHIDSKRHIDTNVYMTDGNNNSIQTQTSATRKLL